MANPEMTAAQLVRVPTGLANCYIVGTPERWVLVDAGTPGNRKNVLSAVAEYLGPEARPAAIVLTHGHFDHSGSARDLAEHWDVEVYAHRLEFPFLDGRSAYPPPDPTVGGFMSQVIRFVPNKKMNVGPNLRELPPGPLAWAPEWEVIETPGHSPGHVSLFRRHDKVLIAGDAFCTVNQYSMTDTLSQRQQVASPPPYYTCDWRKAEASVRKLAELSPKVVAAGHGIPMRGAQATTQLRALANNFPVPEHGRYVREPAKTDETGIVYLPPPATDPIKIAALLAVGAAAGLGGIIALRQRSSRSGNAPMGSQEAA